MILKIKKALGPVVALSLLLVVTVVSVATFNNWYDSFSGALFVKTEQGSSSGAISITNVFLESNKLNIYAKGSNSYSLVTSVKVNGVECNLVGSNVIDLSLTPILVDCSGNKGTNSLILTTNSQVLSYDFSI